MHDVNGGGVEPNMRIVWDVGGGSRRPIQSDMIFEHSLYMIYNIRKNLEAPVLFI